MNTVTEYISLCAKSPEELTKLLTDLRHKRHFLQEPSFMFALYALNPYVAYVLVQSQTPPKNDKLADTLKTVTGIL